MQITHTQIAQFSGARVLLVSSDPSSVITHFTWDSRTVRPGSLFIALPGEHLDGNDYIEAALDGGAVAVLASRAPSVAQQKAAREHNATLMQATKTGVESLQALASGYRNFLKATVIGVTGSSGKTTTKDLIADVLSSALPTYATRGNYNNRIGAPATVLEADFTTKALVVEMGTQASGEVRALCDIARPSIGIITNVGLAHCELLGSRENIARAKAELIESLPDGAGIAILNGDDPYTPFIRTIAQTFERGIKVFLYGLGSNNDIRASHIEYDAEGHPSFDLWLPDGLPRRATVALQGEHNIYNALAAATCGHVCGIAPGSILKALATARPAAMRQEIIKLASGAIIINDTYNANPDSMRAALAMLNRIEHDRLHIAVLGDMFELGEEEKRFHREIGAFAHISRVDLLVTVGDLARLIAQGAREIGMQAKNVIECADASEVFRTLLPHLSHRPIILVKASRGKRLEQIVEQIVREMAGGIPEQIANQRFEEMTKHAG